MSMKSLYRIAGVAAFLSALIKFKDYFLDDPNVIGTTFDYYMFLAGKMFLVLIAMAFYLLYHERARELSIIAVILSAFGFITRLFSVEIPGSISTWIWIIENFIPILIFGILAYRYHELGMPRDLGLIGILLTIVWIIYAILYSIFPDLDMGIADYLPRLLYIVWLIWTGGVFVYKMEISNNIPTQEFKKDASVVIKAILLILVGVFIYNKITTPVGYGVEFPFELDPDKEWGQENVEITCEYSEDGSLDADTFSQLVAAGGKLLVEPADGAAPYYLWIGNVPLDLFVKPEHQFDEMYDYSGTHYCVSGTGVYAGVNQLEPYIIVITKISEPEVVVNTTGSEEKLSSPDESQSTGNDFTTLLDSIPTDKPFTASSNPITAENLHQLIPLAARNMDDEDFTFLDIAPSADLMAVTTSSQVQVYQLSTFELLTKIEHAPIEITLPKATFSADGKFLALYNEQEGSTFFQVLDTQTWMPVELGAVKDENKVINPQGGEYLNSLIFFGDNQYIQLGGTVINLYEKDPQQALYFGNKLINSLSISSDESLIAGEGVDRLTIYVVKEDNYLHEDENVFEYTFTNDYHSIQNLVFSPNGQLLGASSGDELKVWDIGTGEVLFQYQPMFGVDFSENMAFSSDGSLLFVGGQVFNLKTGEEVYSPMLEYLWKDGLVHYGSNQEGTIFVTAQFGKIIYWGIP